MGYLQGPHSEKKFTLGAFVVSFIIAMIPAALGANGDSNTLWCWIRNDLPPWEKTFLTLLVLYAWVIGIWILIIILGYKIYILRKERRYLNIYGTLND